ncbi:MAG: class I SAM-dependent methyltransferase [Desulfobacterales bacterium]
MNADTDKDLIEKYNQVYADGEEKFWTFLPVEERLAILRNIDLQGKTVLEIGCGTGDFAAWMASCGAKLVVAADASGAAIQAACGKYCLSNLVFYASELKMLGNHKEYDFIVMVGVLEHFNNPDDTIGYIVKNIMSKGSRLVITCPLFINPRGFIWVALKYLFDAPMSLTDKHEISPNWIRKIAKKYGLKTIHTESVDFNWGCGDKMIFDYSQRLPKVFPDMDDEKINKMLSWLKENKEYFQGLGANALYILGK